MGHPQTWERPRTVLSFMVQFVEHVVIKRGVMIGDVWIPMLVKIGAAWLALYCIVVEMRF